MSIFDGLAAVEEEILKCMKCGNCQAVCPLYQESRREPAVARGKIRLAAAVLEGKLEPTAGLAECFALCLTCLACVASCPSGVKVDRIILAARTALTQRKGLPFIKKTVFTGLSRPRLFDLGVKTAARIQGLLFKHIEPGKMQPRFPIGLELRRILPPLAPVPFRGQVAEKHTVERPVATVAFFTGCMTNYLYPGIGQATLRVLKAHGVDVIIPRLQHCCGAPILYSGAADLALEMARSHVDLFSSIQADAIITVCGTCGEAFKHLYPELLDGVSGHGDRAREVAAKILDITQFLHKLPFDPKLFKALELAVTYHQPCHLGRGLGVVQEPLSIIRSIPGVNYLPLKEPARCCGNAGSFSLTHYDLSYQILTRKLKDIEGTGAQLVVTGCPACRMHLTDGLTQQQMPQKVVHTVELLARSLDEE
ncbi:(Fe-S)-binding protein [Desulfofundulus salinus]|uniref:Glycolate oxidase iron-sulfur subunit n=1 Tax=Desulfofundulus salinus TaxID=2419843 RepID=A0A494WSS8_9FIRM|nr:(Fe-S)-binding protein [Desulfofundulus salinum]RKO65941.1 (Fe-S)-binding protein [Desulfofundulus salinum]